MSSPHSLHIERDVTEDLASIIVRSLAPEASALGDERSETDVSVRGGTIHLEISADDLVALRAAANTWFGLLEVAERSATAAASRY